MSDAERYLVWPIVPSTDERSVWRSLYRPSWKYGAVPPTERSDGVSKIPSTSPWAQLFTLCTSPSGMSPPTPWHDAHAARSDSKIVFPRVASAASTLRDFGDGIDRKNATSASLSAPVTPVPLKRANVFVRCVAMSAEAPRHP